MISLVQETRTSLENSKIVFFSDGVLFQDIKSGNFTDPLKPKHDSDKVRIYLYIFLNELLTESIYLDR